MTGAATVERLVGVYDADHTLRGELSYWLGARLGRAHCALCDITHGLLREREDWRACRAELPVPFEAVHRDEMPPAVAAIAGELPTIVALTVRGPVVVLGPAAIEACDGDPDALVAALRAALAELGPTLPSAG